MKDFLSLIEKVEIMKGIPSDKLEETLDRMNAKVRTFAKNAYVMRHGEIPKYISVLLSGKLIVRFDDYWGNRNIVSIITPGETFGEAYVTPESEIFSKDVFAPEESVVLYLDASKLFDATEENAFQSILIKNLFFDAARKNRKLAAKVACLSRRSTREKLIAYLSEQAEKNASNRFSIPFNRQQLADYLAVDRSAMSAELCRMRDAKLLTFDKNRFTLLTKREG